mmetsp:Transcript_31988/g.48964  ORF Transcript_31988/g.48964 Transcript_31988/m.48964 type:complete len:194 (-) Transcript_31988:2716-3297(-)
MIRDLETAFDQLKTKQQKEFITLSGRVNEDKEELSRVGFLSEDLKEHLKMMETKFDLREKQVQDFVQEVLKVKKDLVAVNEGIVKRIEDVYRDVQEKLSHFEKVVVDSGSEIVGFRIQIKNIQQQVDGLRDVSCKNVSTVVKMSAQKLDTTVFDEFVKEQLEKDETLRMASKDNFEQMLATDNYLEKYIPFRI